MKQKDKSPDRITAEAFIYGPAKDIIFLPGTTLLLADFSEEQRKLYNEIANGQGELDAIESKENFVEGFRYGAGMMLDVISEYKGQLCQISEE